MGEGVTVVRISDQRWLVGGRSVMPSPGTDLTVSVLGQALQTAGGAAPLSVEVRDLEATLHLVVQADGSVTAAAGGTVTRAVMRWLRPAGTLSTTPRRAGVQADAGSVLQQLGALVDPRDWEAVTTHTFERSTVRGEARSMGVNAKTYTEALTRVRGIAATVTDGTVR